MAVTRKKNALSSASTGVYEALTAPLMALKLPLRVPNLDHCQVGVPETVSGSDSDADNAVPTTGSPPEIVTTPGWSNP